MKRPRNEDIREYSRAIKTSEIKKEYLVNRKIPEISWSASETPKVEPTMFKNKSVEEVYKSIILYSALPHLTHQASLLYIIEYKSCLNGLNGCF